MSIQQLRMPDWGTARKHFAKTSAVGASGGLTATERQDANGNEPVAMIIQETTANNSRVTFDGTTPTATVGMKLTSAMAPWPVFGLSNIKNFDWIREGAADGTIQIVLLY